MRNTINSPKGVSLIAAVFIIVILGFMGVMFVSLLSTSSMTSVSNMQSAQALYLAGGGAEYAIASNIFPNYNIATTNLGAGNFQVVAPATISTVAGIPAAGATTFNVNLSSWATFPATGYIAIEGEILNYTTWTPATQQFIIAAGGRGFGASNPYAHAQGRAVYPSTIVTTDPYPGTSGPITVPSTIGFSNSGVIEIGTEHIYYTSITANQFIVAAGDRGYQGTTAVNHVANSIVNQYRAISTGNVVNARRSVQLELVAEGIAIDNTGQQTNCALAGAGSCSIAGFAVNANGKNRVLIIGISNFTNTTAVASVTYNGINAQLVVSANNNAGTSRVEIWELVAPAGGSNTVTVNMPAASSIEIGAVSFTGVDQSNPIDTSSVNNPAVNNNNRNPTIPITTGANNAWVVDTWAGPTARNFTSVSGAGQIQRWYGPTPPNSINGGGSTVGPVNYAGAATTFTWTLSGNTRWIEAAAALRPAATIVNWQEVVN